MWTTPDSTFLCLDLEKRLSQRRGNETYVRGTRRQRSRKERVKPREESGPQRSVSERGREGTGDLLGSGPL